MTSKQKYEELLEFFMYHIKNNPTRQLKEIFPLLNELLRTIGEPKIK